MAVQFSAISNLWTDATWQTVDSTSYLKSEAASTATTTSYVASQAFTPGIITVEGILLRIKGTTTTPTGTLSVQLWNSTGSAQVAVVTCNATDITNNNTTYDGGWCYFKFGSPVTLLGATNYQVRVLSSVAGTVTVYRDATAGNWSRGLVTSTTASLSASDDIIICGDITAAATTATNVVTYDYTGVDAYNSLEIGAYGKVICQNSPSTNYKLTINSTGILRIAHNGIFEIGNSSTRIDSSSTFILTLTCATNGANYVDVRNYGTFRMFGATKTRKALLTANASIGATSLTTDISTGWKNGDEIGIAGTGGVNQQQQRTLNADASGTTLSISAGLTYATEGTSPVQADIINLSSNVKIIGTSATLCAWTRMFDKSTYDVDQIEYKYMGAPSNQAAISFGNITLFTSPKSVKNCTFWLGSSTMLVGGGYTGVTIDGCCFYNTSSFNTYVFAGGGYSTNKNIIIIGSGNIGAYIGSYPGGIINNIKASNCAIGINLVGASVVELPDNVINGITAYACSSGILIGNSSIYANHTLSNITLYRNTVGMNLGTNCGSTFDTFTLFGNTYQMLLSSNTNVYGVQGSKFINGSIQGGTGVVAQYGIYTPINSSYVDCIFERCSFGTVTSHSSSDIFLQIGYVNMVFNNCSFGSLNIQNQYNLLSSSKVSFQRLNGTAGNHKVCKGTGIIVNDTTIYDISPSSLRLTPTDINLKLKSTSFQIAVASGSTATVSVKVRQSVLADGTAYNGSFPRLILKSNPSAGSTYNSDIICATATVASSGAWETLSYTLPSAVTDNVGMEFYIDCNGTTGWINVDTFTSNNNNSMTYYLNGEPVQDIPSAGTTETFYTFIT